MEYLEWKKGLYALIKTIEQNGCMPGMANYYDTEDTDFLITPEEDWDWLATNFELEDLKEILSRAEKTFWEKRYEKRK